MTESTNGQPEPGGIVGPARKKPRMWLYVGLGLFGFVVLAYAAAFFAANQLKKKAFETVDDIDVGQVADLGLEVINRPDNGPEIVVNGKDPLTIPSEFHATILAPLRNAPRIDKPRGIYLGRILMQFRDGRKLTIMLHHEGGKSLRFKIGDSQFEVEPLEKFLTPATEVEAKIRSR